MRSYIDHSSVRPAAAQASLDAGDGEPESHRRGAADGGATAELGQVLGPLAGMIGYALRRAQLAVFDDATHSFAELDLRPAQYCVLALLGHRPGLKQSDVAAALGIQRANFVTLLDGLERRGLARRTPSPNDRRSHALHLTPEGEQVLARAAARVAAIEADLDARLGPGGRDLLLDMLWRLAGDGGTARS